MKISLIRHGRPEIDLKSKIRHTEFKNWLKEYDCAPVEEKNPPPASLRKDANNYELFVCSDLKRSISSFNLLNINKVPVIDPLFRECELPCWSLGNFSYRPELLVIFYRIMWLLGASANCESKLAAMDRAARCADRLALLADDYSSVAFVGHGFLNRFIATSLRERGWDGPKRPGGAHWSHDVYELR